MVAILMSTYNGATFLKEQVDSILTQNFSEFTLYIRDDGSSDGTWELLSSYEDTRIRLLRGGNLGPAESFFALIREASGADYLFFSDQDDVWYPDKLSVMLEEIRKYEHEPTMVFSDFCMIDETGRQTNSSYATFASLRVAPGEVHVDKLIPHPYVFGCASVMNKALAEIVKDPPPGTEMHDCWIALTASSVGKLIYLPTQTIAHRFHSSNATGRKDHTDFGVRLKRLFSGFSAQSANSALRLHQVNLLLDCYGERLLPEAKVLLTGLSAAMSQGRISTIKKLKELSIGRQKTLNTLFFYLTILGIKGEIK